MCGCMRGGCSPPEGIRALLLLRRGAGLRLRGGRLVLRQRVLLRSDVDLVVPRHRSLEVLDAFAQGVPQLRQLAGAEDEEDHDEDQQQFAEPEIHRKTSSSWQASTEMLPAHFNRTGRPLLWAHRGASAEAPENTLAAFSLALAQDRVLLSSFNLGCLWRARSMAPAIPRALLFEAEQRWILRSALAPLLGACAMHPERVLATPERVSRWRRRGYSVACWTVDDPEAAARLHQSGVNGIFTNVPALMRGRWPAAAHQRGNVREDAVHAALVQPGRRLWIVHRPASDRIAAPAPPRDPLRGGEHALRVHGAGAEERCERGAQDPALLRFEEQGARDRRRHRARPPQASQVERAEQDPILRARRADYADHFGREPAVIGAIAFQLDVHQARKRLQHLCEQRDPLSAEPGGFPCAGVERADDGVRHAGDGRSQTRGPGERLVVDDDGLAGCAPLCVEFHSVGALRERERERGQGVLRRVGGRAAMGPEQR